MDALAESHSSEIVLRWYQKEGIAALSTDLIHCIENDSDEFPVGAFQTGTGKTHIMVGIVNELMNFNPNLNIIVAAHDKRIIKQNYKAMKNEFGSFVGLYSAGLKSRTVEKITVGSIQSMYRHPEIFEDYDIMIIDECHLVNPKKAGMYRTMIAECKLKVVGLTGSPFRLGHGYIHEGKNTIFKKLSYNLCTPENYRRLISEGYLAKMYTKGTKLELVTTGIKVKRGDFDEKQLSDAFDIEEITNQAVDEIIEFGKNYKHWLVFAIDINHANHIRDRFRELGISAIAVHSKMDEDDTDAINDFKSGKYRVAINVNMLTTGFDFPEIDLIAHLRPTKSPVFHVQSNGRGGRPHADKDHTLILDFAGNFEELGPIDNVLVKTKSNKKGGIVVPLVKKCPECGCKFHPAVRVCDACGFEFEFNHHLRLGNNNFDIFSRDNPSGTRWVKVLGTEYSQTSGGFKTPPMLKAIYHTENGKITEVIGINHPVGSFPNRIAVNWLKHRLPVGVVAPQQLSVLMKDIRVLKTPSKILVNFPKDEKKRPKIVNSEF